FALVPGTRLEERGCFSPRKFSMRMWFSFTWTFIGKCAATTFSRASTPRVREPARFRTWAAHVLRSDCERLRCVGRRSVSVSFPAWNARSRASEGNGRSTEPSGPFAFRRRWATVNVTPFGTSTVSWPRSGSVDIGEQPTSDLELPGLLVGEDAPVRGEDENAEVLGGEEA